MCAAKEKDMVSNTQNIVLIRAHSVTRAVELYAAQVSADDEINDTVHHAKGRYVVSLKNGDLIYVIIASSAAQVTTILVVPTPTQD